MLRDHPLAATHPLLTRALESNSAGAIETVDLRPGEPLIEAGTTDDRLFVVLEGELSVAMDSGDLTHVRFSAGDVLGEIGYLTGAARTATVVAATPAQVAAIPPETLGPESDHEGLLLETALERERRALLFDALSHHLGVADPDTLAAFVAGATLRPVLMGERLFADGRPIVALVLGGSFRVEDEHGLVAHVGRGEILGELQWLLDRPAHARVAAWRDSLVAEFPTGEFERLVTRHPETLLAVTRLVARRLATDPIHRRSRPPRPMSVALVAAHDSLDPAAVAGALYPHLAEFRSTKIDAQVVDAHFSGRHVAESAPRSVRALAISNWLDSEEAGHEIVLYVADRDWTEWTRTAIRRADRIVLAVDGTREPARTGMEEHIKKEIPRPDIDLLFVHQAETQQPEGTRAWLERRAVARHDHVRSGNSSDFGRAARRLAGVPHGLVLGGGGARGFASIGVAQALESHRWPVDVVGGTSMGALVGAGLALGDNSSWMVGMSQRNGYRRTLHDITLPLASVFAGRKVTAMLQSEYGDVMIEDLWRPFFAVAANLSQAEELIIDRGPLWEAVRASIAIPGVFSPITRSGDLLVDGGIMNNLPIDIMRRWCEEGQVIAVNVSPRSSGGQWELTPHVSGWRIAASRMNPFAEATRVPSIAGTVLRSMDTNSVSRLIRHTHLADLVIQPDVKAYSILDWDSHEAIIEIGREAGLLAMEGFLANGV